MKFGVDCDGVLADFVSSFVREVNNIWPGKLPIGYQPPNWQFSPDLTQREMSTAWSVIRNKHNWWLSLSPDMENITALARHRVRHPEDEIFIVTARSDTKGMPAMHQTQAWLTSIGITGLGLAVIVDNNKDKSSIFNALGCDANIDDKLEAVIEHDRQTNGAFLLDRRWNREGRPDSIQVVSSLNEFFRRVRERV